MKINQSKYIASYPREKDCPKDGKPEFAFIGRSNVGKSSLINMLLERRELARTSKKPGKTQMINYYLINNEWYLVDLPGYGYASTSKSQRKSWRKMIEQYLMFRKTLICAFILIDSNIPAQKLDIEFMNWMGASQIPFVIVYTKGDKTRKSKYGKQIGYIEKEFLQYWNELPQRFRTSAVSGEGRTEILLFLDQLIQDYIGEIL